MNALLEPLAADTREEFPHLFAVHVPGSRGSVPHVAHHALPVSALISEDLHMRQQRVQVRPFVASGCIYRCPHEQPVRT